MSLLPTWLLKKTYARLEALPGVVRGTRDVSSFRSIGKLALRMAVSPVSAFFAEEWYLSRYPDAARAIRRGEFRSAIDHYRHSAASDANSPSPLFDEAWYQHRYYGVARAIQNGEVESGLDHFLRFGALEGHVPCPYFDSTWYALTNGDVPKAPWSDALSVPYSHFVLRGHAEGRRPNAFFDATWYDSQYRKSGSRTDEPRRSAFEHYCVEGARKAHDPGPYFFEETYVRHHPDVARLLRARAFPNGFAHYVQVGARSGLSGNPFFDDAPYVAVNPGLEKDPQFRSYPSPLAHFAHAGARQGRAPNDLFDSTWYLASYPEARRAVESEQFDSPFAHYIRVGHARGRRPGPRFDEAFYLQRHADIAEAVARKALHSGFSHYLLHGRWEKREGHPFVPAELLDTPSSFDRNGWRSFARSPVEKPANIDELARIDFHRAENEVAYFRSLVQGQPNVSLFREHLAYALLRQLDVAGAVEVLANVTPSSFESGCVASTVSRLTGTEDDSRAVALLFERFLDKSLPFVRIETSVPSSAQAHATVDFFLKGWVFHPCVRSWELTLVLGSSRFRVAGRGVRLDIHRRFAVVDGIGASLFSGFHESIVAELGARAGTTVSIELVGRSSESIDGRDRAFELVLGEITVVGNSLAARGPTSASRGRSSDVAICMATFNPDPELLSRQLESIRAQTHGQWTLAISDESVDEHRRDELRRVVDGDRRIALHHSPARRGFYRNFEAALMAAPRTAQFIALADQDDRWYPEKLETLLGRFDSPSVSLAFADMRLVTREEKVLADTFWTERQIHFEDPVELLIANTVTGAAALLRSELLDTVLPFPSVPHLFHDQWIAMCAAETGEIAFVDRPLHDYVQHGNNVIGAGGSSSVPETRWLRELYERLREPAKSQPDFFARLVLDCADEWGEEPARLSHVLSVLQRRLGRNSSVRLTEQLRGRLAALDSTSQRRTLGAEWRVCAAEAALAHAYANRTQILAAAKQAQNAIRRAELVRPDAPVARELGVTRTDAADDLALKVLPLRISLDECAPLRANILIPEIAYSTFFGGYIGKLQLARKLADEGYRIRLVCVDRANADPIELLKIETSFPGLEGVFDKVEIVRAFGRADAISFHPDDAVIATTWWTAHIAAKLVERLRRRRFLYLIQEYEPFTFPMGSWYAMAHESYSLPHDALFSTALLAEYFEKRKIGVFGDPGGRAIHFSNAIARFPPSLVRPRFPRRLAFYCRPEGHAARNMYEVGTAALRAALRERVFDGEQWEFWGLGTTTGEVPLGPNVALRQAGKLSMQAYKEQLARFDLGLSLMYTPHPSLVPLEMAAAGLLVVTNTCENKTERALLDISERFVPCAPTVEGVVDGLRAAVARLKSGAPRSTNDVKWPQSWDAALNVDVLAFVEECLGPPDAAGHRR